MNIFLTNSVIILHPDGANMLLHSGMGIQFSEFHANNTLLDLVLQISQTQYKIATQATESRLRIYSVPMHTSIQETSIQTFQLFNVIKFNGKSLSPDSPVARRAYPSLTSIISAIQSHFRNPSPTPPCSRTQNTEYLTCTRMFVLFSLVSY